MPYPCRVNIHEMHLMFGIFAKNLQEMGLVEQDEEGGRMITKELRSLMDQILHHKWREWEKRWFV